MNEDNKSGDSAHGATSAGLLIDSGRVLLEKRPDDARVTPGVWDTPGGHIEDGERPEAALIRELEEELSIKVQEFTLALVRDVWEEEASALYRHYVYSVTKWLGEITPLEGQHIAWFLIADVPSLAPLNPLVIEALRS